MTKEPLTRNGGCGDGQPTTSQKSQKFMGMLIELRFHQFSGLPSILGFGRPSYMAISVFTRLVILSTTGFLGVGVCAVYSGLKKVARFLRLLLGCSATLTSPNCSSMMSNCDEIESSNSLLTKGSFHRTKNSSQKDCGPWHLVIADYRMRHIP